MAVIRIYFPKTGQETGTWVADEEWDPLTQQQREQLIYRFIKNHYHEALLQARARTDNRNPNYRWNVV